jgi:hypothetical protein
VAGVPARGAVGVDVGLDLCPSTAFRDAVASMLDGLPAPTGLGSWLLVRLREDGGCVVLAVRDRTYGIRLDQELPDADLPVPALVDGRGPGWPGSRPRCGPTPAPRPAAACPSAPWPASPSSPPTGRCSAACAGSTRPADGPTWAKVLMVDRGRRDVRPKTPDPAVAQG